MYLGKFTKRLKYLYLYIYCNSLNNVASIVQLLKALISLIIPVKFPGTPKATNSLLVRPVPDTSWICLRNLEKMNYLVDKLTPILGSVFWTPKSIRPQKITSSQNQDLPKRLTLPARQTLKAPRENAERCAPAWSSGQNLHAGTNKASGCTATPMALLHLQDTTEKKIQATAEKGNTSPSQPRQAIKAGYCRVCM